MSDMENSDVKDAAPVVEPAALEAPEPAAEEQQAPNVQPDPWPVPMIVRPPSSESASQQPEAAPEADRPSLPLEAAVRALLVFIKAHRTAGDSDLEAAVADVEAALAAE